MHLNFLSYGGEEIFSVADDVLSENIKEQILSEFKGKHKKQMDKILELREIEKKAIAERIQILKDLKLSFKYTAIEFEDKNPELFL